MKVRERKMKIDGISRFTVSSSQPYNANSTLTEEQVYKYAADILYIDDDIPYFDLLIKAAQGIGCEEH